MSFEIPKTKQEIENRIAELQAEEIANNNALLESENSIAHKRNELANLSEVKPEQEKVEVIEPALVEAENVWKEKEKYTEKRLKLEEEIASKQAFHNEEKQKVDALQGEIVILTKNVEAPIRIQKETLEKELSALIQSFTQEIKDAKVTFKDLSIKEGTDSLTATANLHAKKGFVGVGITLSLQIGNAGHGLAIKSYNIEAGMLSGMVRDKIEPQLSNVIPALTKFLEASYAKGKSADVIQIDKGQIVLTNIDKKLSEKKDELTLQIKKVEHAKKEVEHLRLQLVTAEKQYSEHNETKENKTSEVEVIEQKTESLEPAKVNPAAVFENDEAKEAFLERKRKLLERAQKITDTSDSSGEEDESLKKNSKLEKTIEPLVEPGEELSTEKAIHYLPEETQELVSREILREKTPEGKKNFLKATLTKLLDGKKIRPGLRSAIIRYAVIGIMAGAAIATVVKVREKSGEVKEQRDIARKNNEAAQKSRETEKAREVALQDSIAREEKLLETLASEIDWDFYNTLPYAGRVIYVANLKSGAGYLMVNKDRAEVYVVDKENHFAGGDTAILGKVRGEMPNFVGHGKTPEEAATTPAGFYTISFEISPEARAEYGENAVHLVADYETNLYIHPILKEEYARRMRAIKSETPEDNRMSWGCVNLAHYEAMRASFYEGMPAFILPEKIGEGEGATETWMDPNTAEIYAVGTGDEKIRIFLTKLEKFDTIDEE